MFITYILFTLYGSDSSILCRYSIFIIKFKATLKKNWGKPNWEHIRKHRGILKGFDLKWFYICPDRGFEVKETILSKERMINGIILLTVHKYETLKCVNRICNWNKYQLREKWPKITLKFLCWPESYKFCDFNYVLYNLSGK